jgi:hypothetical protein
MGMVMNEKEGSMYSRSRATSKTGTPFAITRSARFMNLPMRRTKVKTAKPRRKGTVISFKIYR